MEGNQDVFALNDLIGGIQEPVLIYLDLDARRVSMSLRGINKQ